MAWASDEAADYSLRDTGGVVAGGHEVQGHTVHQ